MTTSAAPNVGTTWTVGTVLRDGRRSSTSSQVLPYVGATAEEVKALPGIIVAVERAGEGRSPEDRFHTPR